MVLLWVTASAAALGFALPFEGEEGVEGARHARLRASGSGGGGEEGGPEEFGVLGEEWKTGEARLSIRDGRTRRVRKIINCQISERKQEDLFFYVA